MTSEYRDAVKVRENTWTVRRWGFIEEVVDWDDSLKYVVTVADVGRPPFVKRVFRSRNAADDFYDKLIRETRIPE